MIWEFIIQVAYRYYWHFQLSLFIVIIALICYYSVREYVWVGSTFSWQSSEEADICFGFDNTLVIYLKLECLRIHKNISIDIIFLIMTIISSFSEIYFTTHCWYIRQLIIFYLFWICTYQDIIFYVKEILILKFV